MEKQKRLFGNILVLKADTKRESDNVNLGKGVGYLTEKLEVSSS